MPRIPTLLAALSLSLGAATPLMAMRVSLSGSHSSMVHQNAVAQEESYTFLRTPAQVREFTAAGRLVEVPGNDDYQVASGVSFPVARPALLTFVERLGADYRAGCGEPLVVTSLTRPLSAQPGNASPLSVHPAGMAVDLRVSAKKACRSWLEARLLEMEEQGLLDVTREKHPSHYHVAVFPSPFLAYAEAESPDAGSADVPQVTATPAAVALVATSFTAEPAPEAKPDPQYARRFLVILGWAALTGLFLVVGRRRGSRRV
jgi:hypothetical protein